MPSSDALLTGPSAPLAPRRATPTGSVDVSVLIPVRNEASVLAQTVAAMQAQSYTGSIEFLFADGRSDDASRRILEGLAAQDPRIRVLDNPARRTPQALNVALREARGDYVVRMDAHTLYPRDYIAAGVERLERGDVEWVSGPMVARGRDRGSRRVALALSTRLGTGGADFRRDSGEEIEVDSGFAGVWRRATLERHGGWNEAFVNDQDFEIAARIRKDGGRIVCVPALAAGYFPRSTLRALARQYREGGYFRVKTSRLHPESMRPSHVLPPGLLLCLVSAVAGPRPLRVCGRLGMLAYSGALAAVSVRAGAQRGARADAVALPAILATMHFAWGAGFLQACFTEGPPVRAVVAAARRLSGRF